jgi:hypothetical protein
MTNMLCQHKILTTPFLTPQGQKQKSFEKTFLFFFFFVSVKVRYVTVVRLYKA